MGHALMCSPPLTRSRCSMIKVVALGACVALAGCAEVGAMGVPLAASLLGNGAPIGLLFAERQAKRPLPVPPIPPRREEKGGKAATSSTKAG